MYAGAPPIAASLVGLDIRQDPSEEGAGSESVQEMADRLARAGGASGKPEDTAKKTGPVKLGAGLAAVPAVLARKIRRGEYIEFAELPPALPEGSPIGVQSSEQLLIVQAADYRKARRRVPDVITWTRCFILYIGTVATKDPNKLVNFLGYMGAIVRAAHMAGLRRIRSTLPTNGGW